MKSTDSPPAPEAVRCDDLFASGAELKRYRERENLCETMDQSEKLALIRALQEIRDEVGLLGDGVSPRQIVDAVRKMKANAELSDSCPPISRLLAGKTWRQK